MTGLTTRQLHAGLLAAAGSSSGYVARLTLFNVAAAVLIQLLGHVILDVLPQRARVRVPLQAARHLASVRLLQNVNYHLNVKSFFPFLYIATAQFFHSSTSISMNQI